MKHNQPETSNALEHVNPKRRGFLAKMLAGGVALPVMTTVAFGGLQEEDETEGQGKGGRGKGGQGKGGQGKGGQGKGGQGKGGQGKGGTGKGEQGGRGRQQRDPAEQAKEMMKEFDKDGDKKLSLTELTNALKALQERRGQQGGRNRGGQEAGGRGKGGQGSGGGRGKGGQGGGGRGKGKGSSDG